MNNPFKDLFTRPPYEIKNGDLYFDSDKDGDYFDEFDEKLWLEDGIMKENFESKFTQKRSSFFYPFFKDILDIYAKKPVPFLEIACGPGMGLAPIIFSKNPTASALVTDACSLVIGSWRKVIDENVSDLDISLASFSVMDMPLCDDSFDLVTSFIGIGSTRNGDEGQLKALREVYRVLKKGGYFITVENEFCDYSAVNKVFELWGKKWQGIDAPSLSWKEKFQKCRFTVESCDRSFCRKFDKNDNELGEQAEKFGIDIITKYTLYVLRK